MRVKLIEIKVINVAHYKLKLFVYLLFLMNNYVYSRQRMTVCNLFR